MTIVRRCKCVKNGVSCIHFLMIDHIFHPFLTSTNHSKWALSLALLLPSAVALRALEKRAKAAPQWVPVAPKSKAPIVKNATTPSPKLSKNVAQVAVKPGPKLAYNRDIRPILSENCFLCHGPDKGHRKAGLRLDVREDAIADGAIVPGKPDKSELVKRINTTDPDELMPPAEAHKVLSAAQKDKLKLWIAQGAPYEAHWAFIAPGKAALPKIADAKWPKNPIDNFVAAKLASRGLKPSPPAAREILMRRVSFDLTGLPPTPEEVDAVLADKAPDAYEKVVDRLLTSPRYGEHMARPWLDAARYGDTHGLHLDNERHIWPYRDWVVKAFNDNLPFDKFTIYQLAGDLLPNATREQLVATGFNRCAPTSSEGGSIESELLFRYSVDRTETTASVFMGLTAGCASCHDHKFDPIAQKEFYQLNAFWNSNADPGMDGNALRTAPILKLPSAEQEKQAKSFDEQLVAARQKLKDSITQLAYSDPALQNPPPVAQISETVWVEDSLPEGADAKADGHPLVFITSEQGPVKSGQRALKRSGEGTIQDHFSGLKKTLAVPAAGKIFAHVFLDAKNPPKAIMLQFHSQGDWKYRVNWGDADAIPFGQKKTPAKVLLGALPATGEWVRLEFDLDVFKLPADAEFDGLAFTQSGGLVYWDLIGVSHEANPALSPQFSLQVWTKKYEGKDPGDRFPKDVRDIFKLKSEARKDDHNARLREYFLTEVYAGSRDKIGPLQAEIGRIESNQKKLEEEIPATLVWADLPQPRKAHVMIRGAYDKPGEEVQPAVPAALPPLRTTARATRLDFAKWLVAPEHPLTSRVYINRLWQHFFGVGFVKTAGDFGAQGEVPTHPELLDWMSVSFRENWDIKKMVRLIVTSATYRQDSQSTKKLRELDPENRLLARGPRFRLDAEAIRDNALFAGGLIDLTMGGRGVRPYQPPNVWEPVAYPDSNTAKYVQDHGAALYRRSLYTFWKRTAAHPAMTSFDAPSRESSCLRRERSNTPLQALVLMNDVQNFEASRALAGRMIASGGKSVEEKLTFGFRVVASRRPTLRESKILKAALDKQRAHFKTHVDDAKKVIAAGESPASGTSDPVALASYTMVASLLLNLDETVTKN